MQMEGEILVIKKEDLLEIFEGFSKRILNNLQNFQARKMVLLPKITQK